MDMATDMATDMVKMLKIKELLFKSQDTSLVETDIHSHILPGIDDGAKNVDDSITLIKEMNKLGYKKFIATPHISQIQFPNDKSSITKSYELLNKELSKQNIDVDISFSAEYMIDDGFLSLLKNKDILTFGDNYLLFEFSYIYKPLNMWEIIYEIQDAGYTPVLAHPERYLFFHNDFEIYKELKEREVLFQSNLNSIVGYYSKDIKDIAIRLINNSLIDFIGSDVHHTKHIKALERVIKSRYYKKIFDKNYVLNDTI